MDYERIIGRLLSSEICNTSKCEGGEGDGFC